MRLVNKMDYTKDIKDYLALEAELLGKLDVMQINEAINLLDEARIKRGNIYICGNGGSAATASHFQNDFNKGLSEHLEIPFRFCCLNDNTATIMAIANDISYDEIFCFQLRNKLEPNDLLIAISGSGNSKNIIKAAEYAKSKGIKIIGITGFNGGRLKELADVLLHAPINSMQVTEDIHMIFDHLMMSMLYRHLCGIEHLKK